MQLGAGFSKAEIYDGPFALSYDEEEETINIKSGFLSRNGEWRTVSSGSIDIISDGYVCVRTKLENQEWTEPEFVIAEPDSENYPIGYCSLSEGDVKVTSYRVPVAVFIIAGNCEDEETMA